MLVLSRDNPETRDLFSIGKGERRREGGNQILIPRDALTNHFHLGPFDQGVVGRAAGGHLALVRARKDPGHVHQRHVVRARFGDL